MHHLSDEALAAKYIEEGDNRAFQKLVMRHKDRIFGYLLGMVKDRDLANDLFQDTFVRVLKAMNNERGTYSAQGKWLQWAMRIARNAALDHLRSKKRWKMGSSSTVEEHDLTLERLVDQTPAADKTIVEADRKEWLYECIEQLPDEQKEVLLLRHESELTFKEIAELTDCSINTALGRMRYALLNLRRIVEASDRNDLASIKYGN